MRHAIGLSKPKIIFVSPANLEKISIAVQNNSFVKQIILYDNSNILGNTKAMLFSEIFNYQLTDSQLNNFKCKPQNVKEHIACIICSSGTTGIFTFFVDFVFISNVHTEIVIYLKTGLPKGVQITQFNIFVASIQSK